MILSWKQIAHRLFASSCFFLLVLALGACSSSGSAQTTTVSASTKLASHSSTSASTITPKTYAGTHFSISYPQNWRVQGSGNQVIFQDVQGLNALTVMIAPNPGGLK